MEFINQYFIDPILYNTGYNVVNTITYGIILIVMMSLIYKFLKITKIKIDQKFLVAIIPYIALGAILSAIEDLIEASGALSIGLTLDGTVRSIFLISPIIYFTILFIALAALFVSIKIEKYRKFPYYKSWFLIGLFLCLIGLSQMRFVNYSAMGLMLLLTAIPTLLFFAAKSVTIKKIKLFTNENIALLSMHQFDAATTFVALSSFTNVSYFEQHLVTSFLIGFAGPISLFLLKFAVVAVVLYYVDKEEDAEKRTLIKIVIAVLGFGPGLRNFLRIAMGV